jgi:4-hydroxybutyrate dehydrogenase
MSDDDRRQFNRRSPSRVFSVLNFMEPTTFTFPTDMLFGAGAVKELPGRLRKMNLRRPLVVTDPRLPATPAYKQLESILGPEEKGRTWSVFQDVHPNPTEEDVRGAAEAYRLGESDSVIAFGGGSALDTGKAARLLVKRPELKLSEFDWKEDWSGLAPLVCIPTTAGTGSEVGRSSVITIKEQRRKTVLFHPALLSALVILDPELTRGLPPQLTAATGLDALTHCIESFTSPSFHPLCDGIALEGIHLIVEALPRAVRDGNDLDARGKMLVAAAMGAIAFQKDLGAAHSLAHPLSSLCGMHHGTANALCLPAVMRFNAERKPGLYRRVGLSCGLDVVNAAAVEADRRTIEHVENLIRSVGLNKSLRDYGVNESQLDELVSLAWADSCHLTNPIPVTLKDIKDLYLAALDN